MMCPAVDPVNLHMCTNAQQQKKKNPGDTLVAGCAVEQFDAGTGGVCVVEGYEQNKLNSTWYQNYLDCLDGDANSDGLDCSRLEIEWLTVTGCETMCWGERGQERQAACGRASHAECAATAARPCWSFDGPDASGASTSCKHD